MKPWHVGLLVVGAAIAGGLAVRMSQPPLVRMSAPEPVPMTPPVKPAAVPVPPEKPAPAVISAPPPQYETPPAPKVTRVVPMPINPAPYRALPASSTPPTPRETVVAAAAIPVQAPQPAPEPRQVTLHQGAQISVRPDQPLSTESIASGDSFQASLSEPLIADGLVIAEKGARVTGRVVNAQRAGKLSGMPLIELVLSTIQTADGQRVAISTEPWTTQGDTVQAVLRFRLAARVTITERPL